MEIFQFLRHSNLALILFSCPSKPSWAKNRLCFCLLVFLSFLSFFLSFFLFFLCDDHTWSSFCPAPSDPETSISSLEIILFRSMISLSGCSICGLTIFLYACFGSSSSSLLLFIASSVSCCLFILTSSVFFRLSSSFLYSSLRFCAA